MMMSLLNNQLSAGVTATGEIAGLTVQPCALWSVSDAGNKSTLLGISVEVLN